jgi:hypothetical protein
VHHGTNFLISWRWQWPQRQQTPGGASYARAGTHAGESFMLSGAKMVTNDLKMKVSVPFTADDKVNPIPAVSMILKTAQLFDPKARSSVFPN